MYIQNNIVIERYEDCKNRDKDCKNRNEDCKNRDKDCKNRDEDCKNRDKDCKNRENNITSVDNYIDNQYSSEINFIAIDTKLFKHTNNELPPANTENMNKVKCGPLNTGIISMASKDKKENKCTICSKSYKHVKSLKLHMRFHTLENAIVCKLCLKVFAVSSKYEAHKLSHMGVKPFGCECGKRFSTKQSLEGHHRAHSGEKPVQCAECGMRFTKQSSLSRHAAHRHAAEDTYTRTHTHRQRDVLLCAACGRRFGRTDVLRVHMRTCLNSTHA